MKPILTVLITSYNKADTICKAIDSVLMQKTAYPFEVVVLDDGSTDDTFDRISHYDVKIRCFSHRGLGPSIAQGIWECDARFVAVLGADDYWKDDNKLELQISHMIRNLSCGLCYTNGLFVTDSGERIMINQTPDTTYDGLLARTNFVCASMVFRPEILKCNMTQDKFASFMSYDYPLIVLYAYFSRVDYLPYCTTVSLLTTTESLTRTHRRGPRLKFIINAKLRTHWYFISRYGCSVRTALYLTYRYARDLYSVAFKRWYK